MLLRNVSLTLILVSTFCSLPFGHCDATRGLDVPEPKDPGRPRFEERLRSHSGGETLLYVGMLYGVSGAGYLIFQHDAIATQGSWTQYRNNLFRITRADYDVWTYNWGTHILTGAATHLFYRSKGYSRVDSLLLTALQSALFEFTIELYSEPASLEDLINTPVLGATAGTVLEWASFSLLNTDSTWLHIAGHILNPITLFGFHEGEARLQASLTPQTRELAVRWEF